MKSKKEKQEQPKAFTSRTKEREKQQDYELIKDSGLAEFVNSIPGKIVRVTVRKK
jgi:hypothetical protein